jgi:hypothetical protein
MGLYIDALIISGGIVAALWLLWRLNAPKI